MNNTEKAFWMLIGSVETALIMPDGLHGRARGALVAAVETAKKIATEPDGGKPIQAVGLHVSRKEMDEMLERILKDLGDLDLG